MKLFIYDEFNPQDIAMMQALYSRSAASVETHAEKVKASGSGKFMETFYVNYGHASIADCGSTTLFIEGVSILAAKAIQDWPLYSGQETSTRYIDMSAQPMTNPLGTAEAAHIQQRWMDFYLAALPDVIVHVKQKYPRGADEKETVYEKAVHARAFDILRSFLPAGIQTQLSWHTNLRQAADKLALLRHHPSPEIQQIAEEMHQTLLNKYPNSFSHKTYETTEAYRTHIIQEATYFHPAIDPNPAHIRLETSLSTTDLEPYQTFLRTRPAKTNLPLFLSDLGLLSFTFPLDFGSFRDLQRHRNGICRMPLLTTDLGFHPWYLEQLPDHLRGQASQLIDEQTATIRALDTSDVIKQYYVSMGFLVPCRVTYGLPAALYVIELRSGKTVHPTLRRTAQLMAQSLRDRFPDLVIHDDRDVDDWDVRRGLQDITKKENT